jgi:uncharacterized protein YbbC (DUF1343 family)
METVAESVDPVSGLPVVSLYGDDESSLTPDPALLEGLDALVVDLQDVGARYYTFAASAVRCLVPAAAAGVRVIVADRPNPLDGVTIEGGPVRDDHRSFVGESSIPNRHGMTLGEICVLETRRRGVDVDLTVVPARGWLREQAWPATELPWVLPSPNMPTWESALVYPGACLFEGTNLSEGRGTTRPFELVGAPFLEARELARTLDALALPGVVFRPTAFRPMFQKHAGEVCFGVQIHVTDTRAFRPVLTGLAVVRAARHAAPEAFRWRTEPYEFVADKPAFDLLAGGPEWRLAIENGSDPREIAASWRTFENEHRACIRSASVYEIDSGQ